MRKIGLLTYHHTTNFGSLLQTYGLYKAVTDLGKQCEIVNYHNATVDKREAPIRLANCRTIRDYVHYFLREPKKRKKEKYFDQFVSQKMGISKTEYTEENIRVANSEYDTFLIGSDLVWDFSINGNDRTYMLDFANDKTSKIAYASSVGGIWDEKEDVTILLNRFDHIGVREYTIKNTLDNWLNQKVDFVCDPTMLVTQEEWKSMVTMRLIQEDYVLCYMNDKENRIYYDAIRYAKDNGKTVYVLTYGKPPKGTKAISPVRIEEFLSLIFYADAVFSASYHGMLFALYFEKELYFYNRGWRSRMESIALYLGLEDREQLTEENKDKAIDYTKVNKKIAAFREESLILLRSYLDNV